ncbi:SigE family RNA polymerase sigma factor [Streptomyces sp. M10(2022)]
MIRTPDEQDVSEVGVVGVVGDIAIGFDEFARSRQAQLRRAAYLLCGDWHLAEDLTQTALAKLYAVWRKVRMDSPDSYVRKVLFRTFVDETRRRRWWERPSARQYDVAAPADDPDLRLMLLAALRQVPARSRAVLVLRFWEDQSVEETAAALGCSTGTVKSQTSRGWRPCAASWATGRRRHGPERGPRRCGQGIRARLSEGGVVSMAGRHAGARTGSPWPRRWARRWAGWIPARNRRCRIWCRARSCRVRGSGGGAGSVRRWAARPWRRRWRSARTACSRRRRRPGARCRPWNRRSGIRR